MIDIIKQKAEEAFKKTFTQLAKENAIAPNDMDRIAIGIGIDMPKDDAGKITAKPTLAFAVFIDGQPVKQITLDDVLENIEL